MEKEKNCYNCSFRKTIPGDQHSRCVNGKAIVVGHEIGINGGWFNHPDNFDPVWVVSCSGFNGKGD